MPRIAAGGRAGAAHRSGCRCAGVCIGVAAAMGRVGAGQYYRRGGIDIEPLLAPYLSRAQASYGPDFDRTVLTDVNRDLFPKDEFAIPFLAGGSN